MGVDSRTRRSVLAGGVAALAGCAGSADEPTRVSTSGRAERQAVPWGVAHVGARTAHADGIRGEGVDVAVLDTGIAGGHPDLTVESGVPLADGVNSWRDESGHGTHAAGVIGASDNDRGVVGVAPAARLHAVRVFERAAYGDIDRIAAGLRWAAEREVDVASVSLTTRIPSEELQAAARTAADAGVVVVAATTPENTDRAGFPAAYDSVVSVAGVGIDGARGEEARASGVDVYAPGVEVTSTVPDGYASRSGSSVATPHAAGVAALLRGAGVGPRETIERLRAASGDPPVVSVPESLG